MKLIIMIILKMLVVGIFNLLVVLIFGCQFLIIHQEVQMLKGASL